MNNQVEVREFLTTRRARLTPERVGIIGGGRRRVAGLRREEVAMLAGMSVDYYAKMERGNLSGVSPGVLDALARALRLDESEIAHLHALAQASAPLGPRRTRARAADATVRPGLQRLLDSIGAPAYIANQRKDFVATNALGAALLAPILDDPANQRNNARFTFLNPASQLYYPDWDAGASSMVASLRIAAGQDPHNKPLTDLIGELVTRSDVFRARWAAHDVRFHRSGSKRINHPDVGELVLEYEGLEPPASPGLILYVCTPEPGSPTEERLRLLGSLAASGAGALDSSPHVS